VKLVVFEPLVSAKHGAKHGSNFQISTAKNNCQH